MNFYQDIESEIVSVNAYGQCEGMTCPFYEKLCNILVIAFYYICNPANPK
jgi:hypothetical protein